MYTNADMFMYKHIFRHVTIKDYEFAWSRVREMRKRAWKKCEEEKDRGKRDRHAQKW